MEAKYEYLSIEVRWMARTCFILAVAVVILNPSNIYMINDPQAIFTGNQINSA
jgi:hypothetical protein